MPASYRWSLEHNTTFSANNANGKKDPELTGQVRNINCMPLEW